MWSGCELLAYQSHLMLTSTTVSRGSHSLLLLSKHVVIVAAGQHMAFKLQVDIVN